MRLSAASRRASVTLSGYSSMSDGLEFIPGYISPLTDADHARIGRIAVLWGQVEHFVEAMLPRVSGLSWDELVALRVADQPIGQKVLFLKAAAKRLKDSDIQEAVTAFCAAIDETKSARNHVFHGMWGWRADRRTKTVDPAARKTSQPSQPFKAGQLPSLEKRLCACSRQGSDIMMAFWNESARVKYSRYIHHGEREVIPEWLSQWSERNPLDDVHLDRIAKAGQLPRLDAPYPRK